MSIVKQDYPICEFQAIWNLVGGQLSTGGEDGIVYHDGQTPPSDEDIETELARMQAAYNATENQRVRANKYPSFGDQLDDLYHADVFSAEMTAKLKKVKDDNPKS